jgi:hypothetical protein
VITSGLRRCVLFEVFLVNWDFVLFVISCYFPSCIFPPKSSMALDSTSIVMRDYCHPPKHIDWMKSTTFVKRAADPFLRIVSVACKLDSFHCGNISDWKRNEWSWYVTVDKYVWILILGFRRDVAEICALLGYYAASCGNCLPTFRGSWPLNMGPILCPETSVNNYHTAPRNIPEERRYHVWMFHTLSFVFCWHVQSQ